MALEVYPDCATLFTFTPDGKTLAYLAMARPGFEADRLRVVLRSWPEGKERVLAEQWDRSAGSLTWSPDDWLDQWTKGVKKPTAGPTVAPSAKGAL